MTTNLRNQLQSLASSVTITSSESFKWFGRRFEVIEDDKQISLSDAAKSQSLANRLTRRIYEDFYCCGNPRPYRKPQSDVKNTISNLDRNLAESSAIMRWEEGWEVVGDEGDNLVVSRQGLNLRAPLDRTRSTQSGTHSKRSVEVAMPTVRPAFSPGHYLITGQAPINLSSRIWRIYWNVKASGAAKIAAELANRLNAAGIPFHFKFLRSPNPVQRFDGAVMYLPDGALSGAESIIGSVYKKSRSAMEQGVPAMTRPLGPGLAYAQSPVDGESFGIQRSKMIAEGLIAAAEAGKVELPSKISHIEERFEMQGVSLDEPHRSQASLDPLAHWQFTLIKSASPKKIPRSPAKTPEAIADGIAAHLCDTAIWNGSHCTWLSNRPETGDLGSKSNNAEFGTLGPNLYSGLAGIGTFLASYGRQKNDKTASRTGIAALKQAANLTNDGSPGLYSGLTGIALALSYGAALSQTPELAAKAQQIISNTADMPDHGFDVLAGSSGRVLGLLACSKLLDDTSLIDQAVSVGTTLLANAKPGNSSESETLSWSSPEQENGSSEFTNNLLGYSHGTSGVAHALAALFEATGEERFSHAAKSALSYECTHFDRKHGIWPDYRSPESATSASRNEATLCAWCNGAAGIGLSRLATASIQAEVQNLEDRKCAVENLLKDLDRQNAAGWPDVSYCHGFAGSLEILNDLGGARLGRNFMKDAFASATKSFSGIQNIPTTAGPGNLGLMTGLAGFGYFCLRWQNSDLPSLLLIDPDQFQRFLDHIQ